MKMIVEQYFSEDFRRMPVTVTSRIEAGSNINVAGQLDWFEECAKQGTCKRIETAEGIRFDKTYDCNHCSSVFFIKEA